LGIMPAELVAQCTYQELGKTGRLSASTVAQYAHQYFNPSADSPPIGNSACDDLVTAVAIAGMESGFFPNERTINTNCSIDYGLWQNNDDTTGQAPASGVCGVGSVADLNPATAARNFACVVRNSGRGFYVSFAYQQRLTTRAADWMRYWQEA